MIRQAIDIALEVVEQILEENESERSNLDKSRLKKLVGNISRKRRGSEEDKSWVDQEADPTAGEAISGENPRGKVAK